MALGQLFPKPLVSLKSLRLAHHVYFTIIQVSYEDARYFPAAQQLLRFEDLYESATSDFDPGSVRCLVLPAFFTLKFDGDKRLTLTVKKPFLPRVCLQDLQAIAALILSVTRGTGWGKNQVEVRSAESKQRVGSAGNIAGRTHKKIHD
jgi:hypothetical protein